MWGQPPRPLSVPGWAQLWVFPVGWGTLVLSLCSPGAAVLGGMAFPPLKPPELCTGEGLCGCWLQPQCCRAWFQPCLWRPIFNIKTNQRKWNLYYLWKKQVNRAEGSASRKPLGFVWGITTNILHPFGDFRKPLLGTAGEIADQRGFGACGVRQHSLITAWKHCLIFKARLIILNCQEVFTSPEAQYFHFGWWWSGAIWPKALIPSVWMYATSGDPQDEEIFCCAELNNIPAAVSQQWKG